MFVVDEASGVRASSSEARGQKGGVSVQEGAMVAVGGEVGACRSIYRYLVCKY